MFVCRRGTRLWATRTPSGPAEEACDRPRSVRCGCATSEGAVLSSPPLMFKESESRLSFLTAALFLGGPDGRAADSRHARVDASEARQGPDATLPAPHPAPMDESAHSFAAATGNSATGHFAARRGSSPVMITDALSDVRANYHIDPKEIGHGHYGVVRKCVRREGSDWYAIKSIRKSKVSKIEVLRREIEILKEVRHPHIIELIEVYEDERYLHLITELCTGGELFDRIIAKTQSPEGHFSEHDAAKLVRDILDAINYCHEKGRLRLRCRLR